MAGMRSEMVMWGCFEAWCTCARSDSEMGLKWSGDCQNSVGLRQPFEPEASVSRCILTFLVVLKGFS